MLNERTRISYDPTEDEYVVELIPTPSSLNRSGPVIRIPSHVLDELYNRTWEVK
jgi:hypothetical protein